MVNTSLVSRSLVLYLCWLMDRLDLLQNLIFDHYFWIIRDRKFVICTFWWNDGVKIINIIIDLLTLITPFILRIVTLEHQNFPCLKLIKIVILWVSYTIPFGFSLFWHFLVITFQLFILHVWLRITDEGSVPKMRIWSISLIYSD